jgi:arylsulfatase A-like enzyme
MPEKKNVILIMNDSLRRDHVGCFGVKPPWPRPGHEGEPFIQTPNLDRFAEEAMRFDRYYIASYPTVPNRTDLYTGRFGFCYRGWQPLDASDVILPEILKRHGYTTAMIFDTPPLAHNSYNFTRGYDAWDWIRGQMGDRYITDPHVSTPMTADKHKIRNLNGTRIYLRNQRDRLHEADYLAPRTLTRAAQWLERNADQDGFLLWVDTWDPHEPFDPPPHYLALYDEPGYDGQHIIFPQYGHCDYMTPEELNHVRALYAGEVTMCDTWVGYLLDTVARLGLLDDTLILYMSDHGHLFGDHGLEGKPGGQLGTLYEVTARIPLIIRHPEGLGAGESVAPLVQPPDILPTILDFLDIPVPETVQGRSIWPMVRGEVDRIHDHAVSGRFPLGTMYSYTAAAFDGWAGPDRIASPLTVSDETWAYVCAPETWPSHLYHLPTDPDQDHDVIDAHPDVAARMHAALMTFMEEMGSPPERIETFKNET